MASKGCALLFSGGRDSSLSVIKLSSFFNELMLITITSDHLYGIEQVKERLEELSSLLTIRLNWVLVRQEINITTNYGSFLPTCLPCQSEYISIGTKFCIENGINHLGLGYASYQSVWPEQSPEAISILHNILNKYGITLELPVYDIDSKEEAINLLEHHGLSPFSLEQKCQRQETNIELSQSELNIELSKWEKSIRENLEMIKTLPMEILESVTL